MTSQPASMYEKTVKTRSFMLGLTSTGAREHLALGKKANLYSMISVWLYFTDRHQCLVILMHLPFILWDLFKEAYTWLRALANDNIKIGKHKKKKKNCSFVKRLAPLSVPPNSTPASFFFNKSLLWLNSYIIPFVINSPEKAHANPWTSNPQLLEEAKKMGRKKATLTERSNVEKRELEWVFIVFIMLY